jgi:hypothetical protein
MAIEQPLPFRRGSELDVYWNWAPWLAEVGDTIAQYSLAPSPGLLKFSDRQESGKVVTWLKLDPDGGPPGVGAELFIDCSVVTNSQPPRKDTRRILLRVVDRSPPGG